MISTLPKFDTILGNFPQTSLECLVFAARHHGIHLSAAQLRREHAVEDGEPDATVLGAVAAAHGLILGETRLTDRTLGLIAKALPAILRLKNGNAVLLTGIDGRDDDRVATLYDPAVGEATPLRLPIERLLAAATGEALLIRRDQPKDPDSADHPTGKFGLGWLANALWREGRGLRDIALAAAMMSILALAPAVFWQLIVDRVLAHRSLATLNVLVAGIAVVIAADALFGYARRTLLLYATARIDARLSTFTFERLLHLPIDFFEQHSTGTVARDLNEVWRIRSFLTGQLFGTLLDAMVLLIVVPAMIWYSPILAFLVIGIGLLMVGIIAIFLPFIGQRTARAFAAEGRQNAYLVETIQGARTVKSLALEPERKRAWDRQVAEAARLRRHAGRLANAAQSLVAPLEKLMTCGVIAIAAYGALSSDDPVRLGTLMGFGILAQRVAQPLVQLAHLVQHVDEARRAVRIVAATVNQPPEEGRGQGGLDRPITGRVEFEEIRFRYPNAAAPALDRLSFTVPAGSVLGVMGPSGSGKTTITRLLQGLHRQYEGMIRIDGIDIRAIDLDHLRRSTGVVLQESFLFSGTVRDNIAASCPSAGLERVMEVARLAGAEEFIERLPQGYDTRLEEGASNLSGGQRQRLAIARALISDPPLLILDEATSALDPESEAIVNTNLKRIAKGRTVIVISHRLSSLTGADAILVLERGRSVDIGRHEELIQRCPLYRRLWSQQHRHISSEVRHDAPALHATIRG
jgi:subfamily B ATP-binding cassette protein HlyB/CyaB